MLSQSNFDIRTSRFLNGASQNYLTSSEKAVQWSGFRPQAFRGICLAPNCFKRLMLQFYGCFWIFEAPSGIAKRPSFYWGLQSELFRFDQTIDMLKLPLPIYEIAFLLSSFIPVPIRLGYEYHWSSLSQVTHTQCAQFFIYLKLHARHPLFHVVQCLLNFITGLALFENNAMPPSVSVLLKHQQRISICHDSLKLLRLKDIHCSCQCSLGSPRKFYSTNIGSSREVLKQSQNGRLWSCCQWWWASSEPWIC